MGRLCPQGGLDLERLHCIPVPCIFMLSFLLILILRHPDYQLSNLRHREQILKFTNANGTVRVSNWNSAFRKKNFFLNEYSLLNLLQRYCNYLKGRSFHGKKIVSVSTTKFKFFYSLNDCISICHWKVTLLYQKICNIRAKFVRFFFLSESKISFLKINVFAFVSLVERCFHRKILLATELDDRKMQS